MKRFLVLLTAALFCLLLTACQLPFHIKVTLPAKEANCIEYGLTEGVQCRFCGEDLVPQEPIAPYGHQYSEVVVILEPTATSCGIGVRTCILCGAEKQEDLDPLTSADPYDGYTPIQPDQTPTQPGTPIAYGVVSDTGVNIRSGPGTNYDVLGTYPLYCRLTIYAMVDGWAQVDQGWIFLQYVYIDGTVGPNGTVMGTVDGTGVNLRKGPGTDYGINGQVNTGDRVEILFQANTGGRVWGCTVHGWICMDYVVLDGASKPPAGNPGGGQEYDGGIVFTEDDFWALMNEAWFGECVIYYFDESRYNYDDALTYYPDPEYHPDWVVQYPRITGIDTPDDLYNALRRCYTDDIADNYLTGYDNYSDTGGYQGGWYLIDGKMYFGVNWGWGEVWPTSESLQIVKTSATTWTVYFEYEFDCGPGSCDIVWEDGRFKFASLV